MAAAAAARGASTRNSGRPHGAGLADPTLTRSLSFSGTATSLVRAQRQQRSLSELGGGHSTIAAHFAQQQMRSRRNMRSAESDDEWRIGLRPLIREHCGAFVFFRRRSCPACNFLAPKVYDASNDLELKHGDVVLFAEVDVDRCPRTARSFNVLDVPAMRVFSHGVELQAFNGISTRVVSDSLSGLDGTVVACPLCTSEPRASFDLLEAQLEEVLRVGCLPDGRPLCVEADGADPVPGVEAIVPFDFHDSKESAATRLELLKDRIGRSANFGICSRGKVNQLASDFLAAFPDEGMDVLAVRQLSYEWLTKRNGHPSLWSSDEWQALNKMADASVSRRGTRAEYWLLRSLMCVEGRRSSVRAWSAKVRSYCHAQLNTLWTSVRPCVRQCSKCCLPCVLVKGHAGIHSCMTEDHKCHRRIAAADTDDGSVDSPPLSCVLYAGHAGPCCEKLPEVLAWNQEGACAICLEPLRSLLSGIDHLREGPDEDREVLFECRHAFHVQCVGPWLDRKQSCPLCRSPTHGGTLLNDSSDPSSPLSPHVRGSAFLRRTLGRFRDEVAAMERRQRRDSAGNAAVPSLLMPSRSAPSLAQAQILAADAEDPVGPAPLSPERIGANLPAL